MSMVFVDYWHGESYTQSPSVCCRWCSSPYSLKFVDGEFECSTPGKFCRQMRRRHK